MKSPNLALVGQSNFRSLINTPAIAVDLDIMERNIRALHAVAASHNVAVRPHAKAHKCPQIAKMQIAAGAVGICCATVGEAEVMAKGGIPDILLTAPAASRAKLERVAPLNASIERFGMVVDTIDIVAPLSSLAKASGRDLTLLVDVDVGQRRTGVIEPAEVVRVAREIASHPGLRFGGIQGYAGNLQAIKDYAQRSEKCAEVHAKLREVRNALRDSAIACDVVTGAGTGTLLVDAGANVFTETQPGSYLFMDAQYEDVDLSPGSPHPFATSLRLFTSILSANHRGRATTDGGHKSMPADGPAPKVVAGAPSDTVYAYAGDEFGRLEFSDKEFLATPGTLIECHVPHCDTCIAVHDVLLGYRGDTIETVFHLEARGAW